MKEIKSPIIDILENDKELQQLKKQWKEVFPTEGFPSYHYDYAYHDINDYKQKIKKAIETRDRTEVIKIGSTSFLAEIFSN